MLESIAIVALTIIVLIILFIFRKPINQFHKAVTEKTKQWELEVSARCAESELDYRRRMKVLIEQAESENLPTLEQAKERLKNYKANLEEQSLNKK